jgi:choline dehydrogenase-like flavoprotein
VELDDAGAVVIIGSGAGGGTLAHELCRQRVQCVLLEAGPRYELGDFEQDEFAMIGKIISRVPVEVTSPSPADESRPYVCRAVGGTTLHWTAIAQRLHAYEMAARTRYGEMAGASLADWPVTPAELAPYYARAEDKLGVTGTHDIPLLPGNNNFRVLHEGARRIGYRSVDTGRLAINPRARDGRPGCLQMGFCMQGCRIGAKWSTLYTEIPRAEATGRLDLRTGATALQVLHDSRGRASGVLYVDATGRRQLQKARVVCVAANAVESARLLLNSHSARFPHGLANSSGHVGRHYMVHSHAFVMGRMPRPVHFYRGTVQAGLVQDERRHDPARGFASGYQLQQIAFGLPLTTLAMLPQGWGAELADFVGGYSHLAGLVILGEDLPQPGNRVTLSTAQRDEHGLPIASIHRTAHANDRAIVEHARRQAAALYTAAGAERVLHSESTGLTHNMGTLRMSARGDDGVINAHGQAHDVPNLFVSDGSQFPTSGAANPTLTIVALAIRQAEYIRRQLVARAL